MRSRAAVALLTRVRLENPELWQKILRFARLEMKRYIVRQDQRGFDQFEVIDTKLNEIVDQSLSLDDAENLADDCNAEEGNDHSN